MNSDLTEKKSASPLARESVAQIVFGSKRDREVVTRGYNIVEMLEVLIDAGQFNEADRLARRAIEMVNADGRERLFQGYLALCDLMRLGQQSAALDTLERLYVAINHAGHSVPDKVRIALLLARGFALCVGLGTANQGMLLRARNVLSVELDRLSDSEHVDLRCQVVLELAKCYLHAPTPDAAAALFLVRSFMAATDLSELSRWRAFDLERVEFQARVAAGRGAHKLISKEGDEPAPSAERLREAAVAVGGLAPALAELAIARGRGVESAERLDSAAEIFESYGFVSGLFEVMFMRGSDALDAGLNVLAARFMNRAIEAAEVGGFKHGAVLARVGLFQAALLGDDREESKRVCVELARGLSSELALGSVGLNVAAAQQVVGDVRGALKTAQRCERFFKDCELPGFESQAATIVGTCKAHLGAWGEAKTAWTRSARIDSARGAFLQAAEKRCMLAQSILMHESADGNPVKEATLKRVYEVLESAKRDIDPFGDTPAAARVRARIDGIYALVFARTGQHTNALRHLSRARELCEGLGLTFEVALNDALIGLSMLEVGKRSSAELCEEAVLHLQKGLNYFSSGDFSAMRWKLQYYLAVGAILVEQRKSQPHEKGRWRELAVGWIQGAERDLKRLNSGSEAVVTEGGEIDFSPGLKPSAVEALKESLGISKIGRSRRRERDQLREELPADEFLH